MIRVQLPAPLRRLTKTEGLVELEVTAPVTQRKLLDALELRFPMLRGTTRNQQTQKRRAYVRFFACGEDLSDASPDDLLPQDVVAGKEPFLVVGALAGG
ncbi:MAG: MoaD/ThiS family protein [Woeseiaceae bacterium]|nr:MoaD/ThiS family protein [Woeseiaceae bacterium]